MRERGVGVAHAIHRRGTRRVPDVESGAALNPLRDQQLARLRDAIAVGVHGVVAHEGVLNRRCERGLRCGELGGEERVAAARGHAMDAAYGVGA